MQLEVRSSSRCSHSSFKCEEEEDLGWEVVYHIQDSVIPGDADWHLEPWELEF